RPLGGDDPPPPPREVGMMALPAFPSFLLIGGGAGLVLTLALLFVAVAAGAYPVVRRLTRRLEVLKRGVETFGAGQLGHRVAVDGHDEVAAVASSFNHAAERVEQLVRSNRSLLANASHELRSPLARLKMAVGLMEDAQPPQRDRLRQEIDRDIRELDALIDEVLLASRLDARTRIERDSVDLLGLAAEEAARVDAVAGGEAIVVRGEERLLRRAFRNLLENARRYGGDSAPEITVSRGFKGDAEVRVCDHGPGVPPEQRVRIFEPFYRLPGHAEHAGGVGLGLSLVKQIAERHDGSVRCEGREPEQGSCFVISLPVG
ncbi:MAG TPA: HAMP domain-containing sensor histidine kinase, partial [Methylibium sp.]